MRRTVGGLTRFVARLVELRWFSGITTEPLPDRRVERSNRGQGFDLMTAEHWRDSRARCVGLVLDGRARPSGISRRGGEATLLLVVNAHYDRVLFNLPCRRW